LRYQSTTGLSTEQIEELVARISHIVGPETRRGRRPTLGLYRRVVVTLILIRQNLNQMAVGDLFGVSQPTVSRIYRRFMPLVEQVLCLHVPSLADAVDGRLVLVDGTDVPTGRRAGHDENRSGKRHRSGLNIQIASDDMGGLLAVSRPLPGSTHDRRAYADSGWEEALTDIAVVADLGYLGTRAITPRRKPARGELSVGDKDNNKAISSIRSAVERCIAHFKNWKILASGFRGRLRELPNVIRIVTAIEFYRLGW
jgi:hypothetical protein